MAEKLTFLNSFDESGFQLNSNRCVIETLQVVPYGIQELNLSSHQWSHKMYVICVEHPFICLSLKPGDKKLQLLKNFQNLKFASLPCQRVVSCLFW